MSRLGKKPLPIPDKVKIEVKPKQLDVTGPLGKVSMPYDPRMKVVVEKSQVLVESLGESREHNMLHGLTRGLIKNALVGVTQGFKKDLEIQGLGFKAALDGKKLTMSLGFSHPVIFTVPDGIKLIVDKQTLISISGVDKGVVGETAASIRAYKPPEPYKGTGVRYAGEHIIRKVGKTAAGAAASTK